MSGDPERLEHALGLAYRYLSRRERTTSEVHRYLASKAVEDTVAAEAVEVLRDQGYADDARFARLFVQDKRELDQWGAERIRRGLLARGIDRELVEQALRDADVGEGPEGGLVDTELDRALGLLRRRFSIPPRDRRERDRALGVLIRKGYDPELALDAITAYARDTA